MVTKLEIKTPSGHGLSFLTPCCIFRCWTRSYRNNENVCWNQIWRKSNDSLFWSILAGFPYNPNFFHKHKEKMLGLSIIIKFPSHISVMLRYLVARLSTFIVSISTTESFMLRRVASKRLELIFESSHFLNLCTFKYLCMPSLHLILALSAVRHSSVFTTYEIVFSSSVAKIYRYLSTLFTLTILLPSQKPG